MTVEKSSKDVSALVDQIAAGEIRLPEIQRAYVWKPTQVAALTQSLYKGWPSGSLLFWRTEEDPEVRAVAANAPVQPPTVLPQYLLDGQQRLTSIYRVFDDHEEAQIVFNVVTEEFQNQSAATKKDARWVKVHDVVRKDADLFELLGSISAQVTEVDRRVIGQRLQRLANLRTYPFHLEVLTEFPYEEVTQIFVRVNSGGRSLKTTELALATLSARWPGVTRRLEDEAVYWGYRRYGDLDVNFLARALTGAVLGRGLSKWSHTRLVAASNEELERGWATVQAGLRSLVPLLQNNLGVSHSSLIPSLNTLVPLVVLLGEHGERRLSTETVDGLLYWFLVATVRNRYSGAVDTTLGQDIPATRRSEPVKALLANLGVVGAPVEVTDQALVGRTVNSPYFFLSFLAAQDNDAKDWWFGTRIGAGAEGKRQLQYHHIHPQATLKKTKDFDGYEKAQINDLSNLAFISAKANLKISNRSPRDYFIEVGDDGLAAHFVPLNESLRTADQYLAFLAARRSLLANAMTAHLNRFRPKWLDATGRELPAEEIAGTEVELSLYQGDSKPDQLHFQVRTNTADWQCVLPLIDLENALSAASDGLAADLVVAGETTPVTVDDDTIEVAMGPVLLTGTSEDWKAVLKRERAEPAALATLPTATADPWTKERMSFPVTSTD